VTPMVLDDRPGHNFPAETGHRSQDYGTPGGLGFSLVQDVTKTKEERGHVQPELDLDSIRDKGYCPAG